MRRETKENIISVLAIVGFVGIIFFFSSIQKCKNCAALYFAPNMNQAMLTVGYYQMRYDYAHNKEISEETKKCLINILEPFRKDWIETCRMLNSAAKADNKISFDTNYIGEHNPYIIQEPTQWCKIDDRKVVKSIISHYRKQKDGCYKSPPKNPVRYFDTSS